MWGDAPGWQVRCVRCGATRAAAAVGIVRIGAWSWKKFTAGWCSSCRRPAVLAVEPAPTLAPIKPVAHDDEFSPHAGEKSPRGTTGGPLRGRLFRSFAWVAGASYLPFCWVVLAGPEMSRFEPTTRWLLWLVIPGFAPGVYLFHPNDRWEWGSWAVVTLGLLTGLTWLGAQGRLRLWVAVGLALLIAIPSSGLGYLLFALN